MPQIDIKLVSTADTSGAERMKTTLEGVGGSAKNANMAKAELDTSRATRKTIYEQSDPEVSGIEKKMYKNKARIESSNKNMEALEIERRVAVKDKQSSAHISVSVSDREKELYEARAKAGDAGDQDAQDAAGREIERLRVAISRGQFKVVNGVRMVIEEVNRGSAEADRTMKKLKDQTNSMILRSTGQ